MHIYGLANACNSNMWVKNMSEQQCDLTNLQLVRVGVNTPLPSKYDYQLLGKMAAGSGPSAPSGCLTEEKSQNLQDLKQTGSKHIFA